MAKNNIARDNHVWLNFAEGTTMSLVRFFDDNKESMQKVLKTWSKPVLDASNATLCRSLSSHGLLNTQDDGKILLSYIDMIYVEVLRTAMNYGANENVIRGIRQLFNQQFNDAFTTTFSPLAEVLLHAHNGLDVEFTYTYDSDSITLYDYLFAPLFLGSQHEPRMQFSLIPLINKVRSSSKSLPPIKTKHSMYDWLITSDSENSVIEMARSLEGADKLEVKRYGASGQYLASIEKAENKELAKKIEKFCNDNGIEDFTDITIKRRNGGVANVRQSVPKIV